MLYANPSSDVVKCPAAAVGSFNEESGSLTPAQIRMQAASWVSSGKVNEADSLVNTALKKFPYSEDLLVIRALLSEMQQDWPVALEALERLRAFQSGVSPVETWSHYVRVLRCMGHDQTAMTAIQDALQQHPAHPVLLHEFTLLRQQATKEAM